MVGMQIEDKRVHLRQVGEDWIQAIVSGAWEALEQLCWPDVNSQLLTPSRHIPFASAPDLAARIQRWFGEFNDIQVELSRVESVGERLGIFYRLRVREKRTWYIVEQQIFCTLEAGRIARLHLLCSGFQPEKVNEQAAQAGGSPGKQTSPEQDAGASKNTISNAVLEIYMSAVKNESTCAVLTPAIKQKLGELRSGQVLEVRVDDPSAREDIAAWCRLSGNQLVLMNEGDGAELHFWVRKK